MTPEDRAKLDNLREHHAGWRAHYEDADSRDCGCGECNEHFLLARLAEVSAVLGLMQWGGGPEGRCRLCERDYTDGHTPDCRLAMSL